MTNSDDRRGRAGAGRILVVDDEEDLRELLDLTLARMGLEATLAGDLAQAKQHLATGGFQLCLTDMRLPDGDGLQLVRYIAEHRPQLPVAVITAYGSMDNAVSALKAGAFDYLAKPLSLEQIRALVRSALRLPEGGAGDTTPGDAELIGDSAAVCHVREMIAKVARSQAPAHIFGESGSGKERAARMIHAKSTRSNGQFVAVNCGAIPENLMESEFFGHCKGAFTGADSEREG